MHSESPAQQNTHTFPTHNGNPYNFTDSVSYDLFNAIVRREAKPKILIITSDDESCGKTALARHIMRVLDTEDTIAGCVSHTINHESILWLLSNDKHEVLLYDNVTQKIDQMLFEQYADDNIKMVNRQLGSNQSYPIEKTKMLIFTGRNVEVSERIRRHSDNVKFIRLGN